MKLKLSELREGVDVINFWIIKTDPEGNVQRLSDGSWQQIKSAYAEHNYTELDGYHVVAVESKLKLVERKSW